MKNFKLLLITAAVLALPGLALASTAKLQIIHNAADPAAASVDIYVNGDLFKDNFAFRDATPFLDVPAGVTLNVGVAPGTSEGAEDILATFPINLDAGGSYVAVANGVLDPGAFAPNPNDRSTAFTIFQASHVQTRSWWGTVMLRAMHGATDAPGVDIRVRKGNWSKTLYSNVQYGDIGGTKIVFASEYTIDVTLPGQPEAVVASYKADLRSLARGSAFIFASGFLDPSANGGGAAFGLYAALPDGTVLPLAADAATARLQIIHNAADPGAAEVDIYVNGDLLLNDFAFRDATPFIDVPAGVDLVVGVAPGSSMSSEDALAEFTLNLADDQKYVAMATGVLDPAAFAANPEDRSIGFTVLPYSGARERGWWKAVSLNAFHGATDAPSVDIRRRTRWGGSRVLFGNLGYGDFSGYRAVRAKRYILDVTPAGSPGTVVASFEADLRGLRGGAAVVFASGFLDPAGNQNGAAFGLFAALPNGDVVALPGYDKAADEFEKAEGIPAVAALDQNYPNPFNPMTTIAFSVPKDGRVSLKVYDTRGRMVRNLLDETRAAGRHTVNFDGTGLSSGLYFYRIDSGDFSSVKRMTLVK